jgi:hypothetical protein
MANDADKLNYAKRMMNLATILRDWKYAADEVNKTWDKKTYGDTGADEILDTDIGTLPITAAELQNLNYSFVHIVKFLTNDTPTNSDHLANIVDCCNVEGEYTIAL